MGICTSQSKTGPTASPNSPTELTSNTANSSPHQSRAAVVPQAVSPQVQQTINPPALDLQNATLNQQQQQPPQAIPPSGRSDDSHLESPNNHIVHPDIKVHAVITPDLDHDHAQALRIPLGQVTDEQLVAELAERDLDYGCTPSPDYDMKEHHKAAKIPLEAVTDDELLAEVERRQLTLHEDIDESLIFESYEMGKILGHGASGKVYLCMHKQTNQKFACKVIMKDTKMNDAQSMSTEIEIMKRLRHRHVVSMYELFESPTCLWLILELVDGGDLRSFLAANRQTYSEAIAAQHMKQILSGVHYLHSMGVVHRDLKLENILLKRTVDSYEVKIADFGLSALVRIGEDGYHNSKSSRRKLYSGLHEPWGTAEYEPPELLNGAYGPQADIWACGCMLYEMLSGSKAFARREDEKNFDKLYARIRKGEVDFRKSGWWSVTANAKDMIVGMIQVDPQKRLTATEALNHKWIKVFCRDEEN